MVLSNINIALQEGLSMGIETFSSDNKESYTRVDVNRLKEIYGNNLFSQNRITPENMPPQNQFTFIAEKLSEHRLNHELNYENNPDDTYIALVAGSFDVPHENHEWFLRHCRAAAAEKMLEKQGFDSNEIDNDMLTKAITSPNLFLIVSLDSDKNLDIRKSGKAEKGGIKRPIYNWQQRANRLAGYSFNLDNSIFNTVDLVAKECRQDFFNSPLESAATMAKSLNNLQLLDGYIVFDEHEGDIVNANTVDCDTIVISKDDIYAKDSSGTRLSSSYYIKKIRGDK
jgi:hypothetical protein